MKNKRILNACYIYIGEEVKSREVSDFLAITHRTATDPNAVTGGHFCIAHIPVFGLCVHSGYSDNGKDMVMLGCM